MLKLDRRTTVTLLVAGVLFMENLDATVIATALPSMAKDFGVIPAQLSVGVSAYLVALTMFIPASGWAADRYSARRIFPLAIIVFTLASLLCAASDSLLGFTLARILQGLGGAMMVPVGRLIVFRDTPKEEIVQANAILIWPALVAPVLGPPVGGWISMHWSWHWIFLLNLPLGLVALLAAWFLIRDSEPRIERFDLPGFILSGLGFSLFMSGIEMASRADVSSTSALAVLALGIALLGASVRHLRRTAQPLFGLAPFGIRTFRVTAIGGTLFRTAISSAPFLLPLMFQVGFGYTPVEAGALLLWLFAGNLGAKVVTTRILYRFGFRNVLIVNGLLVTAGFAGCALLQADTPRIAAIVLLIFCGATRSMQYSAVNTICYADMPPAQMRDATTLFSVLQQMNAGMGIAVGALFLAFAEHLRGTAAGMAGAGDFHLAFWMMSLLALASVVDSVLLPRNAGHRVLVAKTG